MLAQEPGTKMGSWGGNSSRRWTRHPQADHENQDLLESTAPCPAWEHRRMLLSRCALAGGQRKSPTAAPAAPAWPSGWLQGHRCHPGLPRASSPAHGPIPVQLRQGRGGAQRSRGALQLPHLEKGEKLGGTGWCPPCWGPGPGQDSLGKGLRLQSTGVPNPGSGATKPGSWSRSFIPPSPSSPPSPATAGPAARGCPAPSLGRGQSPQHRGPPHPRGCGSIPGGCGEPGVGWGSVPPVPSRTPGGSSPLGGHKPHPGPCPAAPRPRQIPSRCPRGSPGELAAPSGRGAPSDGASRQVTPGGPGPPLPGHRSVFPLSLARAHGAPAPRVAQLPRRHRRQLRSRRL